LLENSAVGHGLVGPKGRLSKGNRVNIPEPEHGYCRLVAAAATQLNPEMLAEALKRVLFSF